MNEATGWNGVLSGDTSFEAGKKQSARVKQRKNLREGGLALLVRPKGMRLRKIITDVPQMQEKD